MNNTESKPISIGDWIVTFIILAIPFVNIIMLIVWTVGVSTHPSKKSYAQASLILLGIIFVLGIIAGLVIPLLVHPAR